MTKRDDYESAVKLLMDHIEAYPEDPLGYINFGNALLQMNDLTGAKACFEKVLLIDSNMAEAYFGLGSVYYEQLLFTRAGESFEKALSQGLATADTHYMLGRTLLAQGHKELAMPYLLRGMELDPSDTEIAFQYGLTLAQLNYIREAKLVFENLLNNGASNNSDVYYNLGVIASQDDDLQGALKHFEAALRIQSDHLLAANAKTNIMKLLKHNET